MTFELKIAAAVLIFLAGLCGGLLAARLERATYRETLTQYANTFAAGIFLGAGLLHMFGDAQEKFRQVLPGVEFPAVALMVGLGFLAILLIDKVLLKFGHDASENFEGTAAYPYILMLALSFHSLITGIALGLEDHLILAITIFIAVLAHKASASMALAISFMRGNLQRTRARRLMLMFYVTTPIGVMIGATGAAILSGGDEALVEGIFDSIAAGTFIYIAVVNILTEEFQASANRLPLFIMTLLGFILMAVLAIWT